MKFEDIKKANESIMPLNVKGKEYAQVNERIKAFRMCYPEGTIKTEMVSNENGICIFRAEVGNTLTIYEDGKIRQEYVIYGTGTAYEKENSTFINKTSYIENCETSAVGRALGMCGFGIDTSVCSAEEVQNAINNQEGKLKLLVKVKQLVADTDSDYEAILKHYKVESDAEMTVEQLKEAISVLEKKHV